MSKAVVGWADLLHLMKHLPAAQWPLAAQCAGFSMLDAVAPERSPVPSPAQDAPAPNTRKSTPAAATKTPPAASPLFWRLLSDDPNPSAQTSPPAWLQRASGAQAPGFVTPRGTLAPPTPPLAPAPRLATFFRRHLAQQTGVAQLDVTWAVRRLAQGHAVVRLRPLRRRRWPAQVDVVLDRGVHLGMLRQDLLLVQRQLQALLRPRVRTLLAHETPHQLEDMHSHAIAAVRPGPSAVLVLGDACSYAQPAQAAKWQAWARQLTRASGHKPLLLAPMPLRCLVAKTAGAFDVALLRESAVLRLEPMGASTVTAAAVSEAPGNHAPPAAAANPRSPGATALLHALAGLPYVPPWLLQRLRLALQQVGAPVDVATEAEVVAAAEALLYDGQDAALLPSYQAQALEQLARWPSAWRAAVVATVFDALDRGLLPMVLAEYVCRLHSVPLQDTGLQARWQALHANAQGLFECLAASMYQNDDKTMAAQLAAWTLRLFERNEGLVNSSTVLQTAWIAAQGATDIRQLPAGFDAAAQQWLFEPAQPAALLVRGAVANAAGQAPPACLLWQPLPGPAPMLPPGAVVQSPASHVVVRAALGATDPMESLIRVFSAAVHALRQRPVRARSSEMQAWLLAAWPGSTSPVDAELRAALSTLRPLWQVQTEPDEWEEESTVHTLWAGLARAAWLRDRSMQPLDAATWAARLATHFPLAWADAGGGGPPLADAAVQVAAAHVRLPLQAPWPHRVDIGARTLWLDALQRPEWATSIEAEGAKLFATLPSGRRLVWVPATPRALAGGTGSYRLPQACWWDADEHAAFMSRGDDWPKPEWATRHGADDAGWWAEFEVQGVAGTVTQRMRFIPPGRFLMGSPPNEPERYDNEQLHPVLLTRGHWLADTTCTQALWQAVLGSNPSHFDQGGPELPVETVSWTEVNDEFLPALNRCVPAVHASLPTEALWEYACRAGTYTPFSFGQGLRTSQANYDGHYPYPGDKKGEARNTTVAVKALPSNRWGLYQMHGNVWEWSADGLRDYASADVGPAVDPEGPGGLSVERALRGGGWIGGALYCRSAVRLARDAGERYDGGVGFRLARGLPEAGRAEPAGIAEPEARRAGGGAPALRTAGAPRKK